MQRLIADPNVYIQAICIAACYPEDWPLLIICPSSMRLVWYDALTNWLPACLIPEESGSLVVIGNGKVGSHGSHRPCLASVTKFLCLVYMCGTDLLGAC